MLSFRLLLSSKISKFMYYRRWTARYNHTGSCTIKKGFSMLNYWPAISLARVPSDAMVTTFSHSHYRTARLAWHRHRQTIYHPDNGTAPCNTAAASGTYPHFIHISTPYACICELRVCIEIAQFALIRANAITAALRVE